MGKRIAIYARVSTGGQSTANQCQALAEVARRAGWETVETYIDHGVSGAKGGKDRPSLKALLDDPRLIRRRPTTTTFWTRKNCYCRHVCPLTRHLTGIWVSCPPPPRKGGSHRTRSKHPSLLQFERLIAAL